jgi:hypothetical protein
VQLLMLLVWHSFTQSSLITVSCCCATALFPYQRAPYAGRLHLGLFWSWTWRYGSLTATPSAFHHFVSTPMPLTLWLLCVF